MREHEIFMHRCLYLAAKGLGAVAPNPMVGAILVYEGKIIGEGWHEKYGQVHAEVNCISSVKEEDLEFIDKSTLYVSLEPCNHFGKTPPCSDLIIARKIPKVIIGCRDPFALVNGAGLKKLKDHGIKVIESVCQAEAEKLNKRFFTFQQQQRPYIILKWAQSLDGFMGKQGAQTKITDAATDIFIHKWRSEEAAIMIGKNTAIIDDPALTNRKWGGENPIRILVDSNLTTGPENKIFNSEAQTIILNKLITKEEGKNKWIKIESGILDPAKMMKALWAENIQSVLIEGGATLLNSFITAGLWDEARIVSNPKLKLGQGVVAPLLLHSQKIKTEFVGKDEIQYYTCDTTTP